MKRILTYLILLLACLGANAQYYITVGYGNTLKPKDNSSTIEGQCCYNMVDLNVGRSFNFKYGFSLNPELGLYSQWTRDKTKYDSYKAETMGISAAIYLDKGIYNGLSVLTGPVFRCNLYQKGRAYLEPSHTLYNSRFWPHRAALLWKVGLQYEKSHFLARIYYDIRVTDQYGIKYYPSLGNKTRGVLGATVGYKF